jgi:RimJ/RimL family protein N-acetyltransferase
MSPRPSRPRKSPRSAREETLHLADGRELRLRPVDPLDAEPIAGAFALLADDEVRRRYLHPVKELAPEYLRQLVEPTPGAACAVVAAEPLPPGEALVGGVARLTRVAGTDDAEFAILVSRFISGQGVGRELMRRLFEWAQEQGIRRIRGDVLDDNEPMLALALSLGFTRETGGDGPGLIRIVASLPPPRRRSKQAPSKPR